MAGWHNVISQQQEQITIFTFSDGNTYPVQLLVFVQMGMDLIMLINSPGAANDANDTSGSDSDNYDGTPYEDMQK